MQQGMKKIGAIILMILVLMMAALPVMAEEKPFVEIDIYSVNDFHGALRAEGGKPGVALLAGAIQQLGAENPAGSIILGGGDMFAGTLDADEYDGMPVIYAMNQMGFSADVMGNHIFDYDYYSSFYSYYYLIELALFIQLLTNNTDPTGFSNKTFSF